MGVVLAATHLHLQEQGVSKVDASVVSGGGLDETLPGSERSPGATRSSAELAATVDANVGITRSRALVGSPRYMAPEQLRSARDVDARADIWALGVILF